MKRGFLKLCLLSAALCAYGIAHNAFAGVATDDGGDTPVITVTAPAAIVYGDALGDPSASCDGCGEGVSDDDFTFIYAGTMANDETYGPTDVKPELPGAYTVVAQIVIIVEPDPEEEPVEEPVQKIVTSGPAEFAIAKKQLVWSGNGIVDAKEYDGAKDADVAVPPTLAGIIEGYEDVVGIDVKITVEFADPNAGEDIEIIVTSVVVTLTDIAAWKYDVPAADDLPAFDNAAITKAPAAGVKLSFPVMVGLEHEYGLDLAALLPKLEKPRSFGNINYEISVEDESGLFTSPPEIEEGSSLLALLVASAEVGDSAVISVTVTSDNYEDFVSVVTVSAVGKIPVIIFAAMEGGVYNGEPYAFSGLTVTGKIDEEEITDAVIAALYESTDDGGYVGSAAPTNAGAYRLTLSVSDEDERYVASAAKFDFTIEQKEVTITAEDVTLDVGDEAPETFAYTVEGLVGEDTLYVRPTLFSSPDMSAPGTYEIAVFGAEAGANYRIEYVPGTLTVRGDTTAVKSAAREITAANANETAVAAPVAKPLAAEFTAGPNPVSRAGRVNFYRQGAAVSGGTLAIYDAAGNVVRRIGIADSNANAAGRRLIGSWDLRDARGRAVAEGAYLVRGSVRTRDGKRENVSVILGVR